MKEFDPGRRDESLAPPWIRQCIYLDGKTTELSGGESSISQMRRQQMRCQPERGCQPFIWPKCAEKCMTRLHSSRNGRGGAWSRGGVVSQHALRQTPLPPPVNRITDAFENITLPQLRCGR